MHNNLKLFNFGMQKGVGRDRANLPVPMYKLSIVNSTFHFQILLNSLTTVRLRSRRVSTETRNNNSFFRYRRPHQRNVQNSIVVAVVGGEDSRAKQLKLLLRFTPSPNAVACKQQLGKR
ncbi:hypothetical protein T4B_3819 [Trichinella pseudospiralis]|uniref:Uncharacterized protein n=1 Tax=Trichinella pseudospiralis TaxID=6337 RepID=A0A0V1I4F1_TRIPS|nr:hypothetical protein T4A_3144 [Trichinella pseudospiralis]KRZ17709.1 hypothetical protein T4B_3819 [Trichinella pseudospiralis]KRZ35487.1 hypothetical protein T4C_9280 [Trichinella pseudospiralis]